MNNNIGRGILFWKLYISIRYYFGVFDIKGVFYGKLCLYYIKVINYFLFN